MQPFLINKTLKSLAFHLKSVVEFTLQINVEKV